MCTQMNGTTKIDELAKKRIILDGVAKKGVGCLVQKPKIYWGRGRDYQHCWEHSSRWSQKRVMRCFTTKGLRGNRFQSCSYHAQDVGRWLCATKANRAHATDGMLKGGFMLPKKIMFVYGQKVRNWLYGTKPNHICVADWTLKVGFADKAKSCLSRGRNFRSWHYGTKANHVCAADGMLEVGLVIPSQIIFGAQMKCWKLAL